VADSRSLTETKRAIETLRRQLLPSAFDPLGQYPDMAQVQACARAFLVLSHAEVESYLENWARQIAKRAEQVWTTSKRLSPPLTYLLVTLAEKIVVPQSMDGPNAKDTVERLEEAASRVFQRYYKLVNDNHGIKEANLLGLLGPVGVPVTALGATLLPLLEAFGSLRGDHAHHSAKLVVQSVLDPETEYNRAVALATELGTLDGWFQAYLRQIR
jgi:hypothetical protein